jgi:hypothetical protein
VRSYTISIRLGKTMRNYKFRFFLAVFSLMSILVLNFTTNAAPVKFNQVVQIVNVKPGNAKTGSFSQLRLANDLIVFNNNDDDDDPKTTPQDDRVITEIKTDVVEDEVCDCVDADVRSRSFPKWALLGLAAIPIVFLITRDKDKTPTPTTTPTTTPTMQTPTPTPTPTPTITPTPTLTPTPTPPEPVPEPMTILLFGTGLAGIGLAARRKFGSKKAENSGE